MLSAENRPEAQYRRNAAALNRLFADVQDPEGRRRVIRASIIHWMGAVDGPAIAAATLLRHDIRLTEDPLLERWTLANANPEQFAMVAFLCVAAGRNRSVREVSGRYGRGQSQRLAILTVVEKLLAAGGLSQAARWPADGAAPARVVIDRAAQFMHVLGRLDLVLTLRRLVAEIDRSVLASAPVVLFSPNFFHAIGHAVLARALCDLLRTVRGDSVTFSTVASHTANRWLTEALTPDISTEPVPVGTPILNAMSDTRVPVPDDRGFKASVGTSWPITKVVSWAATRWMEEGPIPAAQVAELQANASRFLDECGTEPGRFLVTLHVRDSGYRGPSYADGQRDAAIERYEMAVDAVVAAGGVVVRIGDPAMVPIRPRDHVIDYARSDRRSERLDIALVAACRFHLGTASGMSFVPLLFGKPVLLTNWITPAHVMVTPNTLYLPKPLMDADGKRIPLERQCTRYGLAIHTEHIEADGLYFQENTPEEILDATTFLMAHLHDGRLRLTETMVAEQKAIFSAHGLDPAPVLPPNAMAAWMECR